MKNLKLSEETAKKLYKTADSEFKTMLEETFGKSLFSENIWDRVKTIDDVCEHLNIEKRDLLIYQNAKTPKEKYINACAIIPKIVKIYNEGTILDWNNSSIYKYLPYFNNVGSGWSFNYYSWSSAANSACALYYKSSNLAEKAANNFKDIYIDYVSYQG